MDTKTEGVQPTGMPEEVVVSVRDRAVVSKALNRLRSEIADSFAFWAESIDESLEDITAENYLFVRHSLHTVAKEMRGMADSLHAAR